jgi:hypothetical protein
MVPSESQADVLSGITMSHTRNKPRLVLCNGGQALIIHEAPDKPALFFPKDSISTILSSDQPVPVVPFFGLAHTLIAVCAHAGGHARSICDTPVVVYFRMPSGLGVLCASDDFDPAIVPPECHYSLVATPTRYCSYLTHGYGHTTIEMSPPLPGAITAATACSLDPAIKQIIREAMATTRQSSNTVSSTTKPTS